VRLPITYFEKRHTGDILSRFTSIEPIRTVLAEGIIAAAIGQDHRQDPSYISPSALLRALDVIWSLRRRKKSNMRHSLRCKFVCVWHVKELALQLGDSGFQLQSGH
jgi:hypothetical protein